MSKPNLWYTTFDDTSWSSPSQINGATDFPSAAAPSLVVHQGRLFCAFKQSANSTVSWTQWDGTQWRNIMDIPASVASANEDPQLVSFQGNLYMGLYKESRWNEFIWLKFDGANFAKVAELAGHDGTHRMGLTVFKNRVFHCQETRDDTRVIFSTWDGTTWTQPSRVLYGSSGPYTNTGVSTVAYQNKLYLFNKAEGNSNFGVWYCTYDGNSWSTPSEVSNTKAAAEVGLTVYNGRLHCAWSEENSKIAHASFNGNAWSPVSRVVGNINDYPISLATFKNRIVCAFQKAV